MDITEPWGKIKLNADGSIESWLPLRHHCHDVASVFASLLELPGMRRRLARLAGRQDLDETTGQRLAVLCYLHDLGKVNCGFQARSDPKAPMVGHVKPLVALLGRDALEPLPSRAAEALRVAELAEWGCDNAVNALLDASLSHHGKPWPWDEQPEGEAQHWRLEGGYDPFKAMSDLAGNAFAAFPLATRRDAPPLPDSPGFVHAFAGLVQLADWIASGEDDWRRDRTRESPSEWARRRLADIGLDPSAARRRLAARMPGFAEAFGFAPHKVQMQTAAAEGRLAILESETGSGKTEAALWRFVSLFAAGEVDGLYFALPTRTAAVQLHGRVEKLVERLWPGKDRPHVVLAVPGYLDFADRAGALPVARDDLDRIDGDARTPCVWAAQHPKRYFAATISVGSIDQALLGAIRVKHAHLRAAGLMRHLLVVDEVHSSDAYMRRLLKELLRDHLAAGGHALLLSATLGGEARAEIIAEAAGGRSRDAVKPDLAEAIATPYPLVTSVHGAHASSHVRSPKQVTMAAKELLDDVHAIARLALDAARRGAKVLVLRNTVGGAVEVQRALEELAGAGSDLLFRVEGAAALHHGRFAREDRRLLDSGVEKAVGRTRAGGGLVLAGTQTLEQSLDIDADFLITDLCPADVLLQRIGRLHRHTHDANSQPRKRPREFEAPRCLVLTPEGGLAPFLAKRPGGKSRHGLGGNIYDDLIVLKLTRRLVTAHPLWSIPEENRFLVESAVHSEAAGAFLDTVAPVESANWRKHWEAVNGAKAAMAVAAAHGALRRNAGFMEQRMDADERLATRVGANDRIVELSNGICGPFGRLIRQIAIPGWMAEDLTEEESFQCSQDGPGKLRLMANPSGTVFIYDRFGLSRS